MSRSLAPARERASTAGGQAVVQGVRWGPLAAVLTVALAAGLRLARLDLVQFQSDEATWLRRAEDLVRLGRVPLDGPLSSQGIPAAPHFEYVLAAAVVVSREPMVATAAVALANVAGVAGTVWLGWRAFGPLAGVVAGLLFATDPAAVVYARKIWPPDVVPALAVLLLAGLELGVVRRRAGWAAACLPIAVFGSLTHFGFAVVMPFVLAPVLVLMRARRWWLLALGGGVALLVVLPYLVHHVQTGWEDVKNLRYYASSGPAVVDPQALAYALSVSTGWGGLRIADVLPPTDALPAVVWDGAALVETALLGLGVVVALWHVVGARTRVRGADRLRLAGLLLWLAVPVLATTRHSLPLQLHYFLVLLPAAYLLIGAACQSLLVRGSRVGLGVALAAVALAVAVQVYAVDRLLEFVATGYEPCYAAPLRLTEDTARQAVAFGGLAGATRATVENEDGDADSIAYLLRGAVPRVDLAGVGAIGLGQPPPGGPAPAGSALAAQSIDLSYAPGVRATAVSVWDDPLQGGRVRLALDWQADASATWARPLVWEVRLSNAAGQVVQRASGMDHVPSALAGEPVLSWFTLDTPREIGAGPFQAHLRLIDADRGAPVGPEWVSAPFAIHQTPRCRG